MINPIRSSSSCQQIENQIKQKHEAAQTLRVQAKQHQDTVLHTLMLRQARYLDQSAQEQQHRLNLSC